VRLVGACGGRGACGTCVVHIVEGAVELEGGQAEADGEAGAGTRKKWVRACRARARSDCTVEVAPRSLAPVARAEVGAADGEERLPLIRRSSDGCQRPRGGALRYAFGCRPDRTGAAAARADPGRPSAAAGHARRGWSLRVSAWPRADRRGAGRQSHAGLAKTSARPMLPASGSRSASPAGHRIRRSAGAPT
jgi:ferredoxin